MVHNGLLLSHIKDTFALFTGPWTQHENVKSCEKNQIHKVNYCIVALTCEVQNISDLKSKIKKNNENQRWTLWRWEAELGMAEDGKMQLK